MLAALGFATTAGVLFTVMTKRLPALVALIPIPAIAGLLAGPGLGSIAETRGRDRKPAIVRRRRGAQSCRTNGGRPRTTSPREAS
jgi:hypothetical protein